MIKHVMFALLLLNLVACLPLPFPRTAIVQPQLTITVLDRERAPISGASISYIMGSDPHSKQHFQADLVTDQNGQVSLAQKEKFEWVMPLMMHGVPFYYWSFCIDKDGFMPSIKKIYNSKTKSLTIVLEKTLSDFSCISDEHSGNFIKKNESEEK